MGPNKLVLITGAGGGVGHAASVALAEVGYDLLLTSRDPRKLAATVTEVRRRFGSVVRVESLALDLAQPSAAEQIVQTALEQFGRLDALANVAGYAPAQPIEKITPQIWQQCMDVNLSAVIYLTAAAWPAFRRQQGGIIVNVSSMASFDPFPGLSIYGCAKVALNLFTHCTAQEGRPINLKAVALALGAVETPMLRSLVDQTTLPTERTLDPHHVAQVIRDCITGSRPFESGQTILLPSP
ncbi:MAG: SDR family NAD(P)-dependent oxidoreductase [Phycisphaeraceae bacterium]|nr:SDR family NAD(P)-dependent oxidoreductase [Phycisphaeraceae bacterium]